ncbi:alpha-2,8-polysialyltransferase family protein [Ectothiorhodospira variabilis]|uniref:alpha-2,8-polysialyltransferase family protein n=1 Tax=Ectothiorhodospira variabilis TaxID=505694 RepID=UPI001EFA5395|nr:alpha-2,8-polysialyltransferase family protein [Ectothiorhodospira variabilis]MCG5493460.1 alpha-2,8-polysialyltransferase family protein [Ectothiorhodospira variabilis]MCG5496806.1 alpha-2,8-polysialyltransferase family protein [Ectothiorhodospira variabilis]MCG5502789.1 alpha-2,8-polysialyltransferase family protein [Ectothiorhodospira variabilis]MCG5506423.1 alpha-2,8-polysialyltransferase family protein [Ectothiorhodospira variabilis]
MNVLFLTAKPIHALVSSMLASHFGRHVESHLLQASRREEFNDFAPKVPGFESLAAVHTPGFGVRQSRAWGQRNERDFKIIRREIDRASPSLVFVYSISKPLNLMVAEYAKDQHDAKVVFLEVSNSIYATLASRKFGFLRRYLGRAPRLAQVDQCAVRRPDDIPVWFHESHVVTTLPAGFFQQGVADRILASCGVNSDALMALEARKVIVYLGAAPGKENQGPVRDAEARSIEELIRLCGKNGAALLYKPHPRMRGKLTLPASSDIFQVAEDTSVPAELIPGLCEVAGAVAVDSSAAQNLSFFYGIPSAFLYPRLGLQRLCKPASSQEFLIWTAEDLDQFIGGCLSVGDGAPGQGSLSNDCRTWLSSHGLL